MWHQICTECQKLIEEEKFIEAYDLLSQLQEDKEIVHFYKANTCYALKKIDECIMHLNNLLILRPSYPQAEYLLSACFGIKHDLPQSYKYFESRFKINPTFALYYNRFKDCYWDGVSKGEKIFVFHEAGLGDFIQLARFLPLLKKFFKKIILELPYELNGLIKADEVHLRDNMPVYTSSIKFDYAVSIGSLPFLLNIKKDDISTEPYIFPNKRVFLKEKAIGVCWLGAKHHLNDKHRSAKLEDFDVSGNIYNLTLQPSDYINMELKSFQDTANIIAQLDLVISVDTAVAHLAGAMGKEVHLLLGEFPDWRWGLDDQTTYWYPSMKIFRPNNFKDFFKKGK